MGSDKHGTPEIATLDALIVIAGASGTASRELRPGLSLTVDLGLDDADLTLVAGYLQRIADRIRRADAGAPPALPLDADALQDVLVWEAVAAMFAQAGRDDLDADAVRSLIASALARLRGADGG